MPEKNKAHLIGIAGAGMSALAILLKEAGWQISGSDGNSYEPVSGYLKKNKINFHKKYSAKNIPKSADLVVIGKHIKLSQKNPEVKEAFRRGLNIKSMPEALAMFSRGKNNIIVAGSFGKSTSTALISHILTRAKKDPSYFIGALPVGLEKSSHLGGGKHFVIEGDEYPSAYWDNTSKFLHFSPSSVLLTSALHDHINVFPTESSYKKPYRKLVAKIPKSGLLVYSAEGKNLKEIEKYAKSKTVSYALKDKSADWHARNIKYGVKTSFDLIHKGKKVINLTTNLLGNHNIENIVGSGALLLENKMVAVRDFAKGVLGFKGIKRRLELLNEGSKIPVYEGFGSSYEKAKSVFDALKLHFPSKRIVAVFEPKTFSWRNRYALKWYKNIFKDASEVVLLPPPTEGKDTHEQLSYNQIYGEVKKHVLVHKVRTEKEALAILKKITKKGDVIALVSSGSLLGLAKSVPKLVKRLF